MTTNHNLYIGYFDNYETKSTTMCSYLNDSLSIYSEFAIPPTTDGKNTNEHYKCILKTILNMMLEYKIHDCVLYVSTPCLTNAGFKIIQNGIQYSFNNNLRFQDQEDRHIEIYETLFTNKHKPEADLANMYTLIIDYCDMAQVTFKRGKGGKECAVLTDYAKGVSIRKMVSSRKEKQISPVNTNKPNLSIVK